MKTSETDLICETHFNDVGNGKLFRIVYLFMGCQIDVENDELILKEIALASMKAGLADLNFKTIQDLNSYSLTIRDSELHFTITQEVNEEEEKLWQIEIEGDFKTLANYRSAYLQSLLSFFTHRYCIRDEVSTAICIKSYPYINELENLLREYLLRFFVKKVGSKWWNYNSSDQLRKKSTKNGETRAFAGLLNMEIYNIDFVDLRELVTGNFPRMSSADIKTSLDFIISNIDSKPESARKKAENLKQNYLGNWEKFFAQHIDIKDFRGLWQNLYEIRCIVSHNSLVTLKNFADLLDYYHRLKPKLDGIINDLKMAQLSSEEKQHISEINDKLDEILNLSILLFQTDVDEILENSSFTIALQNLKRKEVDRGEFVTIIENVEDELKCIGVVGENILQIEDDTIPMSCWVKFDDIDELSLQALAYGKSINSFK